MSNPVKSFLICYDICDPKRLRRVHKTIRDFGIPVQFSVFLVELKQDELTRLVEKLNSLINVLEDKVSFYHLPISKACICLGLPPLSDNMLFL
ncbi:MAG: CRISPR-associated endonuclease Cas2 [Methylococcales bacterium]|nr:MAG: CRISPR-associated endonuclease Cas2 [Methylococcales bacterium]